MTPLNPDFDMAMDDIDFILDEMRDSGEWAATVEEPERAEESERGPA